MEENEIKTYTLEKHVTKDIHDKDVNGTLVPVWRNWDKIIKVIPEMVYITSINPGEVKGPHLHIIRHSYYVCIKGKVIFIIKENSGKLSDFKVLLIYPNIQMCEMMPYSIGLLTGILRREGFTVDLFDTTFYVDKVNAQYEAFHDYVQEFDWKEKGAIHKTDLIKDFHKKIEDFNPDLMSILEIFFALSDKDPSGSPISNLFPS